MRKLCTREIWQYGLESVASHLLILENYDTNGKFPKVKSSWLDFVQHSWYINPNPCKCKRSQSIETHSPQIRNKNIVSQSVILCTQAIIANQKDDGHIWHNSRVQRILLSHNVKTYTLAIAIFVSRTFRKHTVTLHLTIALSYIKC